MEVPPRHACLCDVVAQARVRRDHVVRALRQEEGRLVIPAVQQVRSRPAEVDPDDLHELFEWFSGIDTDHPDYVELQEAWAAEYRSDLAVEFAEAQR